MKHVPSQHNRQPHETHEKQGSTHKHQSHHVKPTDHGSGHEAPETEKEETE